MITYKTSPNVDIPSLDLRFNLSHVDIDRKIDIT